MISLSIQTFTELTTMLKELYGFDSIDRFEPVQGGYVGNNFSFFSGKKQYFLKRYETSNTRRIYDIAVAHDIFHNKGIPVIMPIVNNKDQSAFFLDDAWWRVFPFVHGITKRSEELDEAAVRGLGTMLGQMHQIGLRNSDADVEPISLWKREVFASNKLALEYIVDREPNKREIEMVAIDTLRIQEVFVERHPMESGKIQLNNDCLIHGDFTHNNVFFDKRGRIQATFDLDKTCLAPRAYEVARSLIITCFDHAWDETSFELAHAYLDEYLRICPMSFGEFALGLKVYIQHFMHMTWLEKKVILYKSERHESFVFSSNVRAQRLLDEHETLAKRLYPTTQ